MKRMLISAFLIALLAPTLVFAQNGKIRGTVTDSETGEELIGANVLIEGTVLGAATDINGEYVVLNVPPGGYSVRTTFIGYAPVTITNVLVNAALTTTLDFELPPTTIQTEPVLIVAERPLVQRNTTNTVRITSRDDVGNLPIRGTQTILALDAGVVRQDGNLYVRGGRDGELAYFVDGASVTNRLFNSEGVSVVQEAFQELQFQPGGYTAELGGANSGIAKTTMRTGGSKFHASVDYRTDDFAKPGDQFLGTSSFGYRNAVVTFGGPVEALKMRYFGVGQFTYQRSPARFVFPFRFDSVRTDDFDTVEPGRLVPNGGTIELNENFLNRASDYTYKGQSTLLFNLNPISLKLTGSYSLRKAPDSFGASVFGGGFRSGTTWPNNLVTIFNHGRQARQETKITFLNLRGTHIINKETFYEVGIAYYFREFERFDPRFGSDFTSYVDSLAQVPFGDDTLWTQRYRGPLNYSVGQGFNFQAPGAPYERYDINSQRSIEGSIDFVSQITKKWEFKAGGRLETWKMRRFSIADIPAALVAINGESGTTRVFGPGQEEEERLAWARQGRVNNYGYDVFGNKVDGDVTARDAPKKPIYASAYFQNKIEYQDLVLNFGLRYEHFSPKARTFADPLNYLDDFDRTFDIVDEVGLEEGPSYDFVLPRLNFSFPVTDRTVFYAQYGKYVQMPSLNRMFVGLVFLSRTVSPETRGNAFLTPVGFLAKPERLTQYEIGFRQAVTDFAALTVTAFYKNTQDELGVRNLVDETGTKLFTAYLNNDFSTKKGLELTLDLRRTKRLSARVNYTLQDTRGTASNPTSTFGVTERQDIGRFPNFITPLDFNQAHRGTIMLDYRFAKGDGGPILQGLGAFVLFTFNSGHAYTKIKEPESLGQASPYNIGVRALIDERTRFPIEPLNSSSTPPVFNIDLFAAKAFFLTSFTLEFYVNILNVLNTRNVINVYPNTGTEQDDGWLQSPNAALFREDQQYVNFYNAFNLQNRWHYDVATGNDIYGSPRQIRFGVRLEY
ncbi:MAG: TonB-dependent receptor domain-containing protein [Bacteroidota bacterium]